MFAGALSCAAGNSSGDSADAALLPDAASPIADASVDAPLPDAGPKVGTCEECERNQDCEDTHQCVQTGGGKVCLQRCTPDEPDCPEDFMCGGVETTYCAPVDGLCCVDGDDDSYGQGIACLGPDCNDSDGTIHPDADDVCNGVDDDCRPTTPDGTDDPAVGDDCDGPDTDLCKEGVKFCMLGTIACDDDTDDEIDVCDGVDNDCNPGTLDGSGDAEVGAACDSAGDPDLCLDDQKICDSVAMEIVCTDLPTGSVDLCDGLDNDCDPTTPDGAGDPGVGVACDGTDADWCLEGTTFCSGGVILCDDATGDVLDVCDGIDNDCNPGTLDGSGDPAVGDACDGSDDDLCAEGVMLCSVGVLVCTDSTGDKLDVCDGLDNDCNPATPDGAHDAGVGLACDGGDADLCNEGVTLCVGGAVTCGDTTGDNVELCDGADNDCNPTTADGSGDAAVGVACDGGDSDLCEEGTTFCGAGGVVTCGDTTGNTLDVCDGLDNDCNPATGDGADAPWLGSACDGGDTDLCNEGVYECTGGAQTCTDASDDDLDVCDAVDNDCNPATADGSGDTGVGVACDGADSDLCKEANTFCGSGGVIQCGDTTGDTLDVCDGADNDCNPLTADGSGDSAVGVACDGADSDLCNEGTTFCSGGTVQCDDPLSDDLELCNGVDDDCNPATADGSGDALVGVACDGSDADLCNEGATVCSSGSIACTDTTGDNVELCDGADNDCNATTADGSGDALVGVACDGGDGDLCNEGTTFCGTGTVQCSDTTGDIAEVCNGLDDDCNPVTLDGADEAWLGGACDGGDSDLCAEGVYQCSGASQVCTDTTGDTLELCDGADNDCNGATGDGADETWLGAGCDGPDTDLCNEGVYLCLGGGQVCNDASTDTLELCDGADNDCNGATGDGADEAWLGVACDGGDTDLCNEGVYVCSAGAQTCNDTTGNTLDVCDGVNNDCNSATGDGSDEPWFGDACDGGDTDLCAEGTYVCSAGAQSCTDTTGSTVDLCNGVDDDCNPGTNDGSGDTGIGVPCDGGDGDLCAEGTTFCSAGTTQCSDTTGTNAELCNGADDDCNPATTDGSGDPGIGIGCDGSDGDLCNEGTTFCSGGTTQCSDTTGTIADVCDGVDNDCNPGTSDGSGDPLLGAGCDGPDGDACIEGNYSCVGGGLSCSDTTGTIIDICDGINNDCDGSTDELGGSTCPSQHTGAVHVSSWGCSGACVISGCDAGYVNVDNIVGTGCECGPVDGWGGTCGGATTLSVPFHNSANRAGYIPIAGQSDWHRIQFTGTPGPGTSWTPSITLTDTSGVYLMDVKTTSCTNVACGSGAATGRRSWSVSYTYPGSSPSDSVAKPTTVIVRVYRPDGLASCEPYQLQVSNP